MYKALAPGCLGFGKSFLEAAIPAADCGYEGYWFGIEGDSQAPLEETKEMLSRSGLQAAGFTLPVEFRREESVFERDMDKLDTYARYAEAIGADRCITWILPSSDQLDYAENFELHRKRLTKVAEVLKHHGIRLGFEFVGTPRARQNVRHLFIYKLDQTLDLCEAVGTGNCGLLLDVWHWDLSGHTRADFSKITSHEQIVLAHINDAPDGVPFETQYDGVRRLPGDTGVLKINDFFDGLTALGYNGPVLAEPFDKTLTEMTFEQALEITMKAIQKVWPK